MGYGKTGGTLHWAAASGVLTPGLEVERLRTWKNGAIHQFLFSSFSHIEAVPLWNVMRRKLEIGWYTTAGHS